MKSARYRISIYQHIFKELRMEMFSFSVSNHLEKHLLYVSLYLINILSNAMCLGAKPQNILIKRIELKVEIGKFTIIVENFNTFFSE